MFGVIIQLLHVSFQLLGRFLIAGLAAVQTEEEKMGQCSVIKLTQLGIVWC